MSDYGKSKLNCENLFKKSKFKVIKAGFIFGGKPCGFYGHLVGNLAKKKILPIVFLIQKFNQSILKIYVYIWLKIYLENL